MGRMRRAQKQCSTTPGTRVSKSQSLHKVNIRPSVSMLSVLKHLNYKPWFAMAEFVDNAIQSYLDNQRELRNTSGKNYKLRVEIEIFGEDGGRIVVRDNAANSTQANDSKSFSTKFGAKKLLSFPFAGAETLVRLWNVSGKRD